MFFAIIPFLAGLASFSLLYFNFNFVANVFGVLAGIALWGLGSFASFYKKYYVIAEPNEAIIRTGAGGGVKKGKKAPEEEEDKTVLTVAKKPVVAIGTGIWCIPLIHRHRSMKLQQYVFPIEKTGQNSLLCKDSILAEVCGTFKVTVQRDPESILKYLDAAGSRDVDSEDTMRELCLDTLETSLRDACTSKEYQEVFEGREAIGDEIENSVANDFSKIGVVLSVAKLTDVDPASRDAYKDDNLQHAVGLTKIVNITETERRNQEIKKLEIKKQIRDQEVTTEKEILNLNQDEEFAKAEQVQMVAAKQAEEKRKSEEARIQSEEAVAKREIAKQKAVQIEDVEKEKSIETARVKKEEAIQTTEVKKKQAIEVAEQESDIAVANKEAELAAAEEAKAKAEAGAERERQEIITVQVVSEAERGKKKEVIEQEAASERDYIKAKKQAEADAFGVEREAQARQTAAEADFQAKTKAAAADLETKTKAAEGAKAEAMVPVEVAARQVEVDKDRVENVTKPELKAKAENAKVSIDLELGKLKIAAAQAIGVEYAKSVGVMSSHADMTIFGDPSTLADMTEKFQNGMGFGELLNGFNKSNGGSKLMGLVEGIADKFGIAPTAGQDASPGEEAPASEESE